MIFDYSKADQASEESLPVAGVLSVSGRPGKSAES